MPSPQHADRSTCPIALTVDVLGDRWTLLIVRDLVLKGLRHFGELAADEAIATNVLADRLDRLERQGIVQVVDDPDDGRRRRYEPTDRARDMLPIIIAMAEWGRDHRPSAIAPEEMFAHAHNLLDAHRGTRTDNPTTEG